MPGLSRIAWPHRPGWVVRASSTGGSDESRRYPGWSRPDSPPWCRCSPATRTFRSYERAGIEVHLAPVDSEHEEAAVEHAFEVLAKVLADPDAKVLVHRDFVDDTVGGILAGYVVFAGLVDDPRVAAMVIQEIIGRPLGPSGRGLIPAAGV